MSHIRDLLAKFAKFCNIVFLFLLKVWSAGPVVQQINFVLPKLSPWKFIWDHFSTTIISKSIFFNWNITSSPYLEMLLINMIKLLFLIFLSDRNVSCCFLQFVEALTAGDLIFILCIHIYICIRYIHLYIYL